MRNSSSGLDSLLRDWLDPSAYNELAQALSHVPVSLEIPSYNYRHNQFPRLCDVDKAVSGVGLHNVEWFGGLPRVPLVWSSEAVTRPSMIQRDLDFLDKHLPSANSVEPTTEKHPTWSYRELLASLRLGSNVLKHLPYGERVPKVPVREASPPETWDILRTDS